MRAEYEASPSEEQEALPNEEQEALPSEEQEALPKPKALRKGYLQREMTCKQHENQF